MDFKEYQRESRKTAAYPNQGQNFIYPTLGLAGEAGEVAEKVKKIIRDHAGLVDEASRAEIQKELGDVLWYLAQISTELNLDLEEVAQENIKKLFSRLERNQIHGNGDNR